MDVTYGTYWDVDVRDVAAGMTIPWLVDTSSPAGGGLDVPS